MFEERKSQVPDFKLNKRCRCYELPSKGVKNGRDIIYGEILQQKVKGQNEWGLIV